MKYCLCSPNDPGPLKNGDECGYYFDPFDVKFTDEEHLDKTVAELEKRCGFQINICDFGHGSYCAWPVLITQDHVKTLYRVLNMKIEKAPTLHHQANCTFPADTLVPKSKL